MRCDSSSPAACGRTRARGCPTSGPRELELQDARAGDAGEFPAAAVAGARGEQRGRTRERWWAALAITLAGFAAILLWQRPHTPLETQPAARFVLETPAGLTFPPYGAPALSPDGQSLVFAAMSSKGTTQLWIRPLGSPQARALSGTEGANAPFWSPDSTAVAFGAGDELRKLVLSAGTAQRVCALPAGLSGGTWSEAGTIVFASGGAGSTLYRVPAAGGDATPFTTHDTSRGETGHFWPQFLPDGERLLFIVFSPQDTNEGLFAARLTAPGERRRILPDRNRALYVAPGHLLSVRDGVLSARPFDPRRLEVTGEAVSITSGVATWAIVPAWGWFTASATGRLAWFSGPGRESLLRLTWLDREGKPLGTLGGRRSTVSSRFLPTVAGWRWRSRTPKGGSTCG